MSEARHVTGPQRLQPPGRPRSFTPVCGSLPHNVLPGTVVTWEGMGTAGFGWERQGSHSTGQPLSVQQRIIQPKTPMVPRLRNSGLPLAASLPMMSECSLLALRHLPGATRMLPLWLQCRLNLLWPLRGHLPWAFSACGEREEKWAALQRS